MEKINKIRNDREESYDTKNILAQRIENILLLGIDKDKGLLPSSQRAKSIISTITFLFVPPPKVIEKEYRNRYTGKVK